MWETVVFNVGEGNDTGAQKQPSFSCATEFFSVTFESVVKQQ